MLPTPSPSPTLPSVPTTAPALPLATLPQTAPPPAADCQPEIPYLEFGRAKTPPQLNGDSPERRTLDLSHPHAEVIEGPSRVATPEPKRSSNPLDVCNLTSRDPPKTPPKKRQLNQVNGASQTPTTPKLWSPVDGIEKEQSQKRRILMAGEIDYSLPITTTYLKYMRSLGCTDEDALKLESKTVSFVIESFLHDAISHYFYKF